MKTSWGGRAWRLRWVARVALVCGVLAVAVDHVSAADVRAFAARGTPLLPSFGAYPSRYLGAWPDPMHLCILLLILGTLALSIGLYGLRMGRPPR